jgi:hypothetical protein
MAMPKPAYRTPEEWEAMVNSPRWIAHKKAWLAKGGVTFGPGL